MRALRLQILGVGSIAAAFVAAGSARERPAQPGLVVCVSAPACDVGAATLTAGGNAVDAAVATAFALAVTHPAAGNIGGGGFMVIRTAAGGITSFDFRERAPARASPTMYLRPDGSIDASLTESGYLAPGVPGTVRGLAAAHRKFGRLPWRDIVMPAVELAERGFTMSAALARSLNAEVPRMEPYPASLAAYGKPGGGEWQEGDRLVLTDLGRTLRAIASEGPDAFYRGWIADRIVADMQANGGLISKQDLASYRARERRPVRGTYRGFDVIAMGPPSSGGIVLIQMLNILEPLNLRTFGLLSTPALHLQAEAMRRAYLDRARFLGDPDFTRIPVQRLTSKAHGRQQAASIDRIRASSSAAMGSDLLARDSSPESEETTHFSVLDRGGMAVATTYTLEGSYGSHVVVGGAGFLLNNEMGDFNQKPGYTDEAGHIGTRANLIAPGKRMLSNMTPTIVARDGRLVLITGSPGGRTIPNTVLTVVLGIAEFGLSGREAVDLARIHHQWMPDQVRVESARVPDDALDGLRALGHAVAATARQGDAHSIWIDERGTVHGVNDRRTEDSKVAAAADLTPVTSGR